MAAEPFKRMPIVCQRLCVMTLLSTVLCLSVEARHRLPGECPCPKYDSPVCDETSGTTYSNQCFANCAGIVHTTPGACPCICIKIYDPVCDNATGTTYGNACEAKCAGLAEGAFAPGKCPCICPALYAPVCDNATGTTYGNFCEAACDGVTENATTPGECPNSSGCSCAEIYEPVCDTSVDKTYGNACEAACAGVADDAIESGECANAGEFGEPNEPAGCFCIEIYDPVCDTQTGITYGNACQAGCANLDNATIVPGECPCVCTRIYDPVCELSTNTTYSNPCEANCAGASDTVPGECGSLTCEDRCTPLMDPICVITDKGQPQPTTTTYTNPCRAACSAGNVLGSYLGECNARADAACARSVTTSTPVCATSGVTSREFPSSCYASQLGYPASNSSVRVYNGLCVGTEAGQLLNRECPDLSGGVYDCFADPCQFTKCSGSPGAVCYARYCPSFFRDTLLNGICQAVFLDPTSGTLAKCVTTLTKP